MVTDDKEKQPGARFLSAITHDLAQPLHAARLFASALEGKIPDPKQQQMVDNIHASLEVAESMLNKVSLLGKLDAGRLPVVIESVRIQEVIADVISEYMSIAKDRGINLRFVPTGIKVSGDKAMLRRALQQLLSNALRFTKNGKVVVGVRRLGDCCFLQVWDNGKGIDKTDMAKIFDDFYKIQNHDLYQESCFGLGLTIVKRICADIGCEVLVSSWSGEGSVFSLKLPLLDE